MFEPTRIADRFVAHPRHSPSYGCGSLRALGARDRFSHVRKLMDRDTRGLEQLGRPARSLGVSWSAFEFSGRGNFPVPRSGDRREVVELETWPLLDQLQQHGKSRCIAAAKRDALFDLE
jgi:hypothetical protein